MAGSDVAAAPHELLSDREFEVLKLTVSSYRARILEKTGLKNNAELMKYALTHRLVDLNV